MKIYYRGVSMSASNDDDDLSSLSSDDTSKQNDDSRENSKSKANEEFDDFDYSSSRCQPRLDRVRF